MRKVFGWRNLVFVGLLLVFGTPVLAQSTSTNYMVNEFKFGIGGELDPSSASYRGQQSGEMTVGNTASTSYQAQAGFNTTDVPYLEFVVTNASIDLGYLSLNNTKTANATFYVRAYLSSGYVVRTESNPPTNGSYNMSGMLAAGSASPGTEQFGINLVANTLPATFGANPTHSPDSSFGFGAAAAGYNTPNTYKYVKGDVIASSAKSSGQTNYTLSYIFNISPTTPAGQFVLSHILVATATY